MVFADDERESNPASFKFMQNAHAWAQSRGGRVTMVSPIVSTQLQSSTSPASNQQEVHGDEEENTFGSDVASSDDSD